jgi:alpha/beta superfamily hydrolase
MLSDLVRELRPNIDRIDPELTSKFFNYRGPDATQPSRVGYYFGAFIAQQLAQRHSLVRLAHMPAARVHDELGALSDSMK